jgi:predicted enzyme related to lactoylglutathione lyase
MTRQPGDGLIVWYDLFSTDEAATDAFYTELFGWEFDAESAQENGYRMISNDLEPFGGSLPVAAPMQSAWMTYIQVTGLGGLTERAEDLGATVLMEKTEVAEVGHWVFLSDPTGAPFYLFEQSPEYRSSSTGYDTGVGRVIWNELITTDVSAAADFYRQLVGWELAPMSPGLNPYTVAKVESMPVAGLFQPATAPANSMWVVSYQTSDIDATIARVQQLGGNVIHPANTAPGIGRTAWVADPTGALFGLMQPEAGWLQRL